MAQKKDQGRLLPPYLPYKTFWNFIENLRQGVPSRIDRSVMPTYAGNVQSNLLAALQYLKLTDANNAPTGPLVALVNSEGADQQRILKDVLTAAYPFLFEDGFDLGTTSSSHFIEQLEKSGTSGDTTRKAAAFFVAAAKQAGLPLSRFVTPKRGPRPGPRKARKPKSEEGPKEKPKTSNGDQQVAPALSWAQMLLAKFPSFDPAWPDEVKVKWFEAFRDLRDMKEEEEE